MSVIRKLSILMLVLLLPSCVGISTSNMEKTENLEADEGVLLVRTVGEGNASGKIFVHDVNGGGLQLGAVSLSIKPGEQVLLLKIKGNTSYSLTRYATYGGGVDFGKEKFNFTITPGKINYIGDVTINQKSSGLVRTRISDEEKTTLAKAKQTAPWLFEKYAYKKALIKIAPGDEVVPY